MNASYWTPLAMLLLASSELGCSSDASSQATPDSSVDAGHEKESDASTEAAPDALKDSTQDHLEDASQEAGPDSAPDSADSGDNDGFIEASPLDSPPETQLEASTCEAGKLPALKLTAVASGLSAPLFATAPAGDARLFIVEQGGRIKLLDGGTIASDPFLDLTALVSTGSERGLLGMALHPDYGTNGRFWVNYTDVNGDTVVAEYQRSQANPNLADPQAVRQLFAVQQPFANHNGGMIAFGPDHYLYVGMGDGGSSGDPNGNGQNLQTKLGKILRIDVDAYPTPPPGNASGGDPQIWDWGLRNPWRFSFDRVNGDLYIADVGQSQWEEVDVEPAGTGSRNYGWNTMEGAHCYHPSTDCVTDGLQLPVVEYDHSQGCSITGGYVYRGAAIPCLQGRYLYADYCTNRVASFVWNGNAAVDPLDMNAELDPGSTLLGAISSFGEDAQGEMYIVSSAGTVYRIDPE